jgi:hypothetical protein
MLLTALLSWYLERMSRSQSFGASRLCGIAQLDRYFQKSDPEWPSRSLDFEERPYTPEYKEKLRNIIWKTFDLHYRYPMTKQQQNEIFRLCHALIRQKYKKANTDTLESICNFFRGLYIAGWTSAVICVLIFLKQIFVLIVGIPLFSIASSTFNQSQLLLGALLSLIFFSSIFWMKPRWKQYIEYYIDSVYTNIYVWNQMKKQDEQAKKKEGSASVG